MKYAFKLENFDLDKLNEKKLIVNGELSDKFCNAYYAYYNRLYKYLSALLRLHAYDREIMKLDIPIIKKKINIPFNQTFSFAKFLYIDNILHIERLSSQAIDILSDMSEKNLLVSEVSMNDFISKTYKEVIRENNTSELRLGVSYDLDLKMFNVTQHGGENLDELLKGYRNEVEVVCQEIESLAKQINLPIVIKHYGYDENVIQAIKESAKEYDNNKSM